MPSIPSTNTPNPSSTFSREEIRRDLRNSDRTRQIMINAITAMQNIPLNIAQRIRINPATLAPAEIDTSHQPMNIDG